MKRERRATRRWGLHLRRVRIRGRRKPPSPVDACPNCGTSVSDRFCAHCGQRQAKRAVSVRQMVRDVLEDQLAIGATLPRTLTGLLFRPGFLTEEYFAGRIVRYIPPFRLYLVSSLFFFIILPVVADFDRLWRAMEPHVEEAVRGQPTTGSPGHAARAEIDTLPSASQTGGSAESFEQFALVRSNIDTTAVPGWLKPVAGYYVRQEAKINAMTPREGAREVTGAHERLRIELEREVRCEGVVQARGNGQRRLLQPSTHEAHRSAPVLSGKELPRDHVAHECWPERQLGAR